MKIILAGAWQYPWYQQALADGFEGAGASVIPFDWWRHYFPETDGIDPRAGALRRAQHKFVCGPLTAALQRRLIDLVRRETPDLLLACQATHVTRRTLRTIRRLSPGTVLASYNNDDPFSPEARGGIWCAFRAAVADYDINFAYRSGNVRDIEARGGRARLLRAYSVRERDYPEPREALPERFLSEVLFAGHYEADGRLEALLRLAGAGVPVRVVGGSWEAAEARLRGTALESQLPIRSVLDEDYQRLIRGAKIALCFLSRKNRDTYTRRNFEIPANGTMCLSEYSDDLATLFEDGREIVFFRNGSELVDSVLYYLAHPRERAEIAAAGHDRVKRSGQDNHARAREIIDCVGEMKGTGA